MNKTKLGELLKEQILNADATQIKNEDQEALDTFLSMVLVRGTDKSTAVQKGGWLNLYRQVCLSPEESESGISNAELDRLSIEQGMTPRDFVFMMQNVFEKRMANGEREHAEIASDRQPTNQSLDTTKNTNILGFPAQEQSPDDPFQSLSPEDIERTDTDLDRLDDSGDDLTHTQEILLAADTDVSAVDHEFVATNIVIRAGNVDYLVWTSNVAVPEVFVESTLLPVDAKRFRFGGYQFVLFKHTESAFSTLVGCKIAWLKSLTSTGSESESEEQTIEAEIET